MLKSKGRVCSCWSTKISRTHTYKISDFQPNIRRDTDRDSEDWATWHSRIKITMLLLLLTECFALCFTYGECLAHLILSYDWAISQGVFQKHSTDLDWKGLEPPKTNKVPVFLFFSPMATPAHSYLCKFSWFLLEF